jgi:hypothetical protein
MNTKDIILIIVALILALLVIKVLWIAAGLLMKIAFILIVVYIIYVLIKNWHEWI